MPKRIGETEQMCDFTFGTIRALVCGKLKSMSKEFQNIGREAHSAGVFEPKRVIMTYWPQEERIKNILKN